MSWSSVSAEITAQKIWEYTRRTLSVIRPSNNVLVSFTVERSTTSTTATKLISVKILHPGHYNACFELRTDNSNYGVYARIYRNGAALGTQRSTTSVTYVSFCENLPFSAGDTLEIWGWTSNAAAACYVRNPTLKGDPDFYYAQLDP